MYIKGHNKYIAGVNDKLMLHFAVKILLNIPAMIATIFDIIIIWRVYWQFITFTIITIFVYFKNLYKLENKFALR